MNPLKTQYFFAYGVMGSLLPFLPIYLKQEQRLHEGEIGLVLGAGSIAILLTPVLTTLLADTTWDARRLTALTFAISGMALLTLYFVTGFWIVLALLAIHSLAYAGVLPLHDGMAFSLQRQVEQRGERATPYHRIRVWGTIGFILPSLFLFLLLDAGWNIATVLLCGVVFSLLSLLNALRLPDPRLHAGIQQAAPRFPTVMAARMLLRPHVRTFCIGMFLVYLGVTAFGGFYPLYLVEVVGVRPQWVGLIFNFGVVLEIAFMLGLGWLHAKIGLRNIMILGVGCFIAQTLALGLFPNVWVAILAQTVHGMIILAVFISPVIYINQQAGDQFRNSMQGLYTMAVLGVSRFIGIVVAGQCAQIDLRIIPFGAAALGAFALALFVFNFREASPPAEEQD